MDHFPVEVSMRPSSRNKWRSLIDEQIVSGFSVNEFCERKCIQPNLFYRWRKRLACGDLVEIRPEQNQIISRPAGPIMIKAGGFELSVGSDFDETTLRRVLALVTELAR